MSKISTTILLIATLIVGAGCIYELAYIYELRQDVAELSANIRQLEKDSQTTHTTLQDVKYDIKDINKAVNLILAELWLVRPPNPEDQRPLPIGTKE